MDDAPEILAFVGYPLWDGDVVLTKQITVTLEEAETYHRLGFVVLVDPATESAYYEWQRWHQNTRWRNW